MAYCSLSGLPVFDQGYPVDGAQLYAYDTGTTTPRNLYLTAALDPTQVHPVPVTTLDGVLPVMFAGAGNYDVALYDPTGGLIRRIVGLQGEVTTATSTTTIGLSTGDYVAAHRTGNRTGFVRANGGTIGSSGSAGSERANDDCHALFVYLWTQDQTPGQLIVSGGRGQAGAEADWAANKTITLPNLQNRMPLGVGDQGNAGAQASITGGKAPNGTVLGALGGEATHVLTGTEIGVTATGTTGSSQNTVGAVATAHNTLPPFAAVSWYIKL